MTNICEKCVHGDIATETRTIDVNGMKVTQSCGGVLCRCDHIEFIELTGGEMLCSSFQQKED